MTWIQNIDPLGNKIFSALIAVIPVLFIFWALVIKKMKGYKASILALMIAVVIAVSVYRMPVKLTLLSSFNGILYGLFPICWIIIAAVFLFNLTVKSGQFEIIRHFMASVSADRRIQALLIAFSFGSFLEGTAGFGAPVAITAAMLVGLGFNPLYAAGICLIANTAPVAFGSIGIPITVASQVSSLPEMAISQMLGRTLPFLSILLPFYLVFIMSGFRKTLEVWPAVLVSGGSFALLQWLSANYLGPALPDIIAGIGSIICLLILLRFWKPKSIWRFPNEPSPTNNTEMHYSSGKILRALSPFILMAIMIIAWGTQPIKQVLNAFGLIQFEMPGIHNIIADTNGNLLPHIFRFNYLSAAGTSVLIASVIAIPLAGLKFLQGLKIFWETLKQLRFPVLSVASVLGFAYVLNDSGMTITMAVILAHTGFLFPFFSPVLGWLGVFITGSDTSSNALFAKLQSVTASSIGVDPVVTVSANASGGVVGKMISPQSIAVAAGAGNLVGQESDLFRFTLKHSFIMLFFICIIVMMQAYLMTWIIPVYDSISTKAKALSVDFSEGYSYLTGLIIVLVLFYALVKVLNRNKAQKAEKASIIV